MDDNDTDLILTDPDHGAQIQKSLFSRFFKISNNPNESELTSEELELRENGRTLGLSRTL